MVGFMKRFATAYQIVKRLLDENRLGKITMISGKFCSGPYQESRMFVLDYAIHHLDLVRYFAGDVKRLYAEKCELGPGKISIAVNLQSVDGTVGALSLSSCESWTRHNERLEIIGDENFVIVDEKLRVLYYPKEDWIDLSDPQAEFGKRALGQGFFWEPNPPIPAWENQSLYTNGYFGEIKHFIDCIQSNREPAPSMVDGLRAMELVHALQMSVENQRIVELEQ
jgi:predicted dehydrogenase